MQKWTSEKKDEFLVLWRKGFITRRIQTTMIIHSQKIVKNISNRVNMPCKINTVQLITHNTSCLISFRLKHCKTYS